ncbi:transglycosylase SLT domain-containing protein [Nocardia terpenica]|uniref:C40 family peptidase n=1 Tax=Nocardia terpenica TaxID=455432 RepID=UPI002FE21C64
MLAKFLGTGSAATVFIAVVIAAVVATVAVYDQTGPITGSAGEGGRPASPEAAQDVPADRLALYQQAAHACPGLDWSVLAGIGKVETDHSRSRLPGVTSGENSAGAAGPMQFLAPTFDAVIARHGLPPGGAAPPTRYDPVDAVYAAAWYLCDSGAPTDLRAAIFAYNHDESYVTQVLDWARRYCLTLPPGSGDCRDIRATSPAAATAISFACAQLGQPYVWGGNGPEVNGGWDCSGLVQAAYRAAGITLPRTTGEQYATGPRIPDSALAPGDLVFYGTPVDIHHVGLYLGAGIMIHAPDFGKPVQISDHRFPGDDFLGATRPWESSSSSDSENPALARAPQS